MAEKKQSPQETAAVPAPAAPGLSLDWWAVIIALALAALVVIGLIPAVAW